MVQSSKTEREKLRDQLIETLVVRGLDEISPWNPLNAGRLRRKVCMMSDYFASVLPSAKSLREQYGARGARAIVILVVMLGLFTERRHEKQPRIALQRAPGSWMLRLSGIIFSKRTNDLVFQPLVADYQSEYFEALNRSDCWSARRIRFRYSVAFVCAFARKLGAPVVLLIIDIIKRAAS